MPEDKNYTLLPGEYIVEGMIDWHCGAQADFDKAMQLEKIWTSDGLMVGNVIKKVTTFLRIPQCMACRGRQIAYNRRGLEIQAKIKDAIGL